MGTRAVEPPTSDEQITEQQRLLRANARLSAQIFRRSDLGHGFGVQPDEEVSTGAIASVTEEADGWRARWVVVREAESIIVRSLHLEPIDRSTPHGGVTANLLRELSPMRAISAAAVRVSENFSGGTFSDLRGRWAGRDAQTHGPGPEPPTTRRGRPPLTRDHKAQLAEAYLEEMDRRDTMGRLGKRFKRAPATIRSQVLRLRSEGFLSAALAQGRKGAVPGPELIQWRLEQAKEEAP